MEGGGIWENRGTVKLGTASVHLQKLPFVFSQTPVDLSSASTPPV